MDDESLDALVTNLSYHTSKIDMPTAAYGQPRAMLRCLTAISFALVAIDAVSQIIRCHSAWAALWNLDGEGNIPAWFSSLLLAGASAVWMIFAWVQTVRGDRRRWSL